MKKIENPKGLDKKILQVLYKYYKKHRGSPALLFTSLVPACGADKEDVLDTLADLKEKQWLDFSLLTDGSAGLVWYRFDLEIKL